MKELIPSGLKVDFIGKRALFFPLSLIAFVASIWLFVSMGDAKYGTDFTGGHEYLVSFTGDVDSQKIRDALAGQGMGEARVQAFQGEAREFSIRLSEVGDSQAIQGKIEGALKATFADGFKVLKADYVGPTVGKELRRSALLAVVLSIVGMLIYIAFRFEMAVGVGSIVALVHDVVISTGVYLAFGHEINMATLAAALTIVGYSVNDTVVIFDRVREERNKRKSYKLAEVVNEAINFTLSRTIITHVLTLFSALALYVIGGGEIADLSLYLVAGIICGAYSTIFVVSPIVILWERWGGTDSAEAPAGAHAKSA